MEISDAEGIICRWSVVIATTLRAACSLAEVLGAFLRGMLMLTTAVSRARAIKSLLILLFDCLYIWRDVLLLEHDVLLRALATKTLRELLLEWSFSCRLGLEKV